jgi:hypothetical protein
MKFNIVIQDTLLYKVKQIKYFTPDLGKSILNKKTLDIEFKNDFIEQYAVTNNRLIYKCGNIGTIDFYTDIKLQQNVLLISVDDIMYNIEYDGKSNMGVFLANIIQKIEEHTLSLTGQQLEQVEHKTDDSWVANDDKNKNKKYEINQTLDKDDYLKKMLERRKNAK